MADTFDVDQYFDRDSIAVSIADKWTEWNGYKTSWDADRRELRNFIFATDTSTTQNKVLPWKNTTVVPKLAQIRDNLHANYMAALFSNQNWLRWEGFDQEAVTKDKASIIEAYMKELIKRSNFKQTVSALVFDFIDSGNVFADLTYVQEAHTDPDSGERISTYTGPKVLRISPNDIVFNAAASSFTKTPKIVRTVKTLGELKKDIDSKPELSYSAEAFNKALNKRRGYVQLDPSDQEKANAYIMDGFGSYQSYMGTDYVELLEFEGDFFNMETGELLENHVITVMDRNYVLRKEPLKSWTGESYKKHAGWRPRPDNLWAMGPLDNLVGMQYRIDHLENLKADVYDMIAFPMLKIKGEVDDFEYGPNERIHVDEDGDVEFLHPDVTALNADSQIAELERRMEELAGAPKEAMGIRTPGEKTKFEVQTLQNSASRIFQNKITYFEEIFLEPLINAMFEMARRHLEDSALVPVENREIGIVEFQKITKEDVTLKGKFYPQGARHFAAQAQLMQDLLAFSNSPLAQDSAVNSHISGKKIAELMEDILGLEKYGLFEENVRVIEQMETQRLMNSASNQLEGEGLVDPAGPPIDEEPPIG